MMIMMRKGRRIMMTMILIMVEVVTVGGRAA